MICTRRPTLRRWPERLCPAKNHSVLGTPLFCIRVGAWCRAIVYFSAIYVSSVLGAPLLNSLQVFVRICVYFPAFCVGWKQGSVHKTPLSHRQGRNQNLHYSGTFKRLQSARNKFVKERSSANHGRTTDNSIRCHGIRSSAAD